MGMRKICAKMVPGNLTDQQLDARVSAVLTSKCITVMLKTSYSPDLSTCDFFLFQKFKTALKGQHFKSTVEVQKTVTQILNDIPQNVFRECYKQRQHR
jgi:hypothetical protein